nr:hypothetical protein [Oxalobacteraceae bacterium]
MPSFIQPIALFPHRYLLGARELSVYCWIALHALRRATSSLFVLSALVFMTMYSSDSRSQSSCGFFDPKVRFADGTSACLNTFPLFVRQGLITNDFPDVVSVAKSHSAAYAVAATANPRQCPFVQFTSWNWSGQEASYALPGCEKRLEEAAKKFPTAKGCTCEVLIDGGRTRLSKAQFEERLSLIDRFLATGVPQGIEESRLALDKQRIQDEERLEAGKRKAEEGRRAAEEQRLAKAIQDERERVIAAERLRAEERRLAEERQRFEKELAALKSKLQADDKDRQNASIATLADPLYFRNRVALVVGNSAYSGTWALRNPANDARAMAERLDAIGFDVTLVKDLKVTDIGTVMASISQKLKAGGAFVFYYAGHGVQLRNENYFPAVDANIRTQFDVPTQSLSLQQILSLADDVKSELRIIMLDACRNNPWMVASRSISGGLAKVEAPKGTLISYATRPGSVAEDGTGQNGLYTGMLLKHMLTPNLPIESMFKRVARDVEEASRGGQEPWHEGNLRGEFAFVVKR